MAYDTLHKKGLNGETVNSLMVGQLPQKTMSLPKMALSGPGLATPDLLNLSIRYITLQKPIENDIGKNRIDIERRILECKSTIIMYKCPICGRYEARPVSCKLRICSRCEPERRNRVFKNLIEQIGDVFKSSPRDISLLTLTLQGHHEYSKEKKRKFDAYVRKLHRDLKFVGVKVLETKYKGDGLFYYHYHLLILSGYVPQKIISEKWESISGSPVVDIRRIKSFYRGLSYFVKYAASPLETCNMSIDKKSELYLRSVYKTRVYSIIGMKAIKLDKEKPVVMCPVCNVEMESIGSISLKETSIYVVAMLLSSSVSHQKTLKDLR